MLCPFAKCRPSKNSMPSPCFRLRKQNSHMGGLWAAFLTASNPTIQIHGRLCAQAQCLGDEVSEIQRDNGTEKLKTTGCWTERKKTNQKRLECFLTYPSSPFPPGPSSPSPLASRSSEVNAPPLARRLTSCC